MSSAFTCDRCKAVTNNAMPTIDSNWTRLSLHGTQRATLWRELDFCPDCSARLRQMVDDFAKELEEPS